ncbi:hypothetical protein, partial [Hydrogenophaga sp.]|uniref:hypothetical protein n=1 Tax=Hydrogenophaga sp. TaxID=1904254 RepID=UPI0035B2C341
MTHPRKLKRVTHLPDAPTDNVVLIPKGIGPETLCKLRGMDAATLRAVLSSQQIDALAFRTHNLPLKEVCIPEGECGEGRTELIVVCPYCHSEAISATAGDRCSSLDRGAPRCLDVFV